MEETIQQLPRFDLLDLLSFHQCSHIISEPTCTIMQALLIRRAWLKDERMEAEIIKVKHRDHSSNQLNWSNIFTPLNRQGFFSPFQLRLSFPSLYLSCPGCASPGFSHVFQPPP